MSDILDASFFQSDERVRRPRSFETVHDDRGLGRDADGRALGVLANRAIALGWALKGSCKTLAHRLFATARWLVPEAERFLVLRTDNCHRSVFKVAAESYILPLRVAAGALIVLVLLGSLDLATRATAISTQPLVRNSEAQHESQIASKDKVGVSKFSGTALVSRTQPVPLPTRKPRGIYKLSNEKGANEKSMAQQKGTRAKATH